MVKNLITGIGGFVASHLADYLLEHGEEVYGTYRWTEDLSKIQHIKEKITLISMDLNDLSSCIKAIEEVSPDYVYHLAAQSFVNDSFRYPEETLRTNIIGTYHLLEAIHMNKGCNPVIHVCSSSEVYGQVQKDEVPIKETNAFRPANPYAVSKVGEDMIAYLYWLNYKMKIIRTRMFTHSVSRWTPVIIRDKNGIDIKYISELYEKERNNQIWNLEKEKIEIWNYGKWTKIINLSCHPINHKKILEITCRGGSVDATDNHSIINSEGYETEASKLIKGNKVKITNMPTVDSSTDYEMLDEELAWLYGLFVAEGDFAQKRRFRISNKDKDLLTKAGEIILRKLGYNSILRNEKNELYRLDVLKCSDFVRKNYNKFYAKDKNKRIPLEILNSAKDIKKKFLEGYNLGDGDNNHEIKSEFYRFKTKSPILAMGLCFITENLGFKYKIHIEHRKEKRYYEIRLLNQLNTNNGRWLLKSNDEIVSVKEIKYEGEVWDFETENHWFNAGIGGLIVHNTGPRRSMESAEIAFAKQIVRIEKGLQEPVIKVGNLNSVRTFADVRDAVRAYYALAHKCTFGEVYNIGGNLTMSIGEMLKKLISLSNYKGEIKIEIDPKLLRPADVTLQIPDISKFVNETGWKPTIHFDQTLKDILDYWRENIK